MPSCASVTLAPAMGAPVSSLIVPLIMPGDGGASGFDDFDVWGQAGEAQRRSATASPKVIERLLTRWR
jgi:hypothetical protein